MKKLFVNFKGNVKKYVEQAVGSDIIFNDNN